MTAAAYFIAHPPQGFFPLLNGGELAALNCFGFFILPRRASALDPLRRSVDSSPQCVSTTELALAHEGSVVKTRCPPPIGCERLEIHQEGI